MSRITPPVTKLTSSLRNISSSTSRAQPSALLSSNRATASLSAECNRRNSVGSIPELTDGARSHTTLSTHRPTAPAAYKPRPLMQGFRTSAPKQAQNETANIDFIVLPELSEPVDTASFSSIRVPLLPDNFNPDRSANSPHALEAPAAAVPAPEISVVAAHPEVLASALTEVVNNAGLEVDVGHWIKAVEPAEEDAEQSTLQEILGGMVGDFFKGSSNPKLAM